MTGIIILAAGSSSRLGKPKQNLIFNGQTLLQRAIQTALKVNCGPVITVLGGNADLIKPTLENFKVDIIFNADWQQGMSSSIRGGIQHLHENHPETTSAILMLCDQPFVDEVVLQKLIPANKSRAIVASGYNETIGSPAFFDRFYFDELLSLKGNEGAKHLLLKYREKVVTVPFDLGSVDIDTIEDFQKLSGI
ncbi:MAG: nucleotidyltransferase family protein [Bacteroidota bacterium]